MSPGAGSREGQASRVFVLFWKHRRVIIVHLDAIICCIKECSHPRPNGRRDTLLQLDQLVFTILRQRYCSTREPAPWAGRLLPASSGSAWLPGGSKMTGLDASPEPESHWNCSLSTIKRCWAWTERAFDCVVMQTLLLSQSHYVLKMIGVLAAFWHPNVGWIFSFPSVKQEGISVSFGKFLSLKPSYNTTASYRIILNRTHSKTT